MKYQTKLNQFSIIRIEPAKSRKIQAIKIDVRSKKIKMIEIENNIDSIQHILKIFKYEIIPLNKEKKREYIIAGIDSESIGFDSFTVEGINRKFFHDAVVVGLPKNLALEHLQKTSLTEDEVSKLIHFCPF